MVLEVEVREEVPFKEALAAVDDQYAYCLLSRGEVVFFRHIVYIIL